MRYLQLILLFSLIIEFSFSRESLIPNIDLDLDSFYYEPEELIEFFNTKVNKTEKLTQRFEEFYRMRNNNSYFCGVFFSINR